MMFSFPVPRAALPAPQSSRHAEGANAIAALANKHTSILYMETGMERSDDPECGAACPS